MPKSNFPQFTELSIRWCSVDDLKPYSDNPRTHSRAQIRKLQRSLKTRGWTNPLLIDDDGNLLAGHGRLEAAMQSGETHVPVISLGQMSEAERRAYIIADNKLAEDAGWSKELLRSELSGLIELGYDVELTGFDTFEIDGLLSFDDDVVEEDSVELLDDEAVPVCRTGDRWSIADHKLAVGDCRNSELIAGLLDGELVRMVLTDPPYGCRIKNNVSGNGRVKHDDFLAGAGDVPLPEFGATLIRPAFAAVAPHCLAGALCYVFTDWRAAPHMFAAADGIFLETKNLIVWVKDPGMGNFYRSAHELCYVFKVSAGDHTSNI
ncbi:ParB N-terminal domain-containing protein, partial [Erythrobacter sp. EC-HK427]|uniref:ParB N-terminal domain-containing protein n=1 Tax=Erythrobacter sp. EC-HK427 TaxID=2038396 RepID=UPI00125FA406